MDCGHHNCISKKNIKNTHDSKIINTTEIKKNKEINNIKTDYISNKTGFYDHFGIISLYK
jgi:hypothetical protein